MKNRIIVSALMGATAAVPREGISYVVIGDYGNVEDLRYANAVFDSLNTLKLNAEPGSPEDFQFFITTGDNLYPMNDFEPTEEEIELMMGLFTSRDGLKDLPIYPTRGNHDCYFTDMMVEVNIRDKFPTWKMDGLW